MSADRVPNYVSAFFEAVGERWTGTLDSVAAAVAGNAALAGRLDSGRADDTAFAVRQRLLDGLIPADTDLPVRNLLYALLQGGDLALLPELSAALRQRLARTEVGPTPVEVVSAVMLADDQRLALVAKLAAQYGSNLAVNYRVDPAILGGLIVRIGDKLIDGSVASKLAAMKQTLGVATSE